MDAPVLLWTTGALLVALLAAVVLLAIRLFIPTAPGSSDALERVVAELFRGTAPVQVVDLAARRAESAERMKLLLAEVAAREAERAGRNAPRGAHRA